MSETQIALPAANSGGQDFKTRPASEARIISYPAIAMPVFIIRYLKARQTMYFPRRLDYLEDTLRRKY